MKPLKLILFTWRENISKRRWKTVASSLKNDLLSRIFFNLKGIQSMCIHVCVCLNVFSYFNSSLKRLPPILNLLNFLFEISVSYFPVHNTLLQIWLESNLSRKAAGTSQVSCRHPVDLGSPYPTLESGTGMSDAKRGKFFPCFFIPPASEMPLCCSSKYLMNNLHHRGDSKITKT